MTNTEKTKSELVVREINPHVITLSKPFAAFNMLKVGGRATLVRLTSGSVAVFSPVPLTEEITQIVKDVGPIRYIIAINMEHYLYVQEWKSAYPQALVVGPPGLQEKRFTPKNKPNEPSLKFDIVFRPNQHASISEEFDADFDSILISSHFNQELVFNFRPTRTLIEGDVWFNLPATEQYSRSTDSASTGFVTRLATRLHSSKGDSLTRRLMWYGFCGGKTKKFGGEVRAVAAWNFDSIIPCHGAVVESGGKQVYKDVLVRYI